jgi:hypothetical protein
LDIWANDTTSDRFNETASRDLLSVSFIVRDSLFTERHLPRCDWPHAGTRAHSVGHCDAPWICTHSRTKAALIAAHLHIKWIGGEESKEVLHLSSIWFKRLMRGQHSHSGRRSIDSEIPGRMFGEKSPYAPANRHILPCAQLRPASIEVGHREAGGQWSNKDETHTPACTRNAVAYAGRDGKQSGHMHESARYIGKKSTSAKRALGELRQCEP